jgi:opacity protein-like surface antigen
MRRFSGALLAIAASGVGVIPNTACADNPLGLYVGAGVGVSTVRSDDGYFSGYGRYDRDHHTAGEAVIGIRPIPIVGAEIEYIDFGHPGGDNSYDDRAYYYGPDTHPRAIAAFAVGHIPLPLPFLDVYAKAGEARLHTNVDAFDGAYCPPNPHIACSPVQQVPSRDEWSTRFAYGAGVQYRIWDLSFGAEYQRISSPFGDPDLLSVRATWTF